MNRKVGALLDLIYEMSDAEHLSDLKYEYSKENIIKTISLLPLTDYSLEQWAYAFSYITGKSMEFRSDDDLKNYIVQLNSNVGW